MQLAWTVSLICLHFVFYILLMPLNPSDLRCHMLVSPSIDLSHIVTEQLAGHWAPRYISSYAFDNDQCI
jgi:hypothetical protein